MSERKRIGILGCGWLGRPLARRLLELGYDVSGSTTSSEKLSALREDGIDAQVLTLTPGIEAEDPSSFFSADILFLNIPPDRQVEDPVKAYGTRVQEAVAAAEEGGCNWIIFASATSVYPSEPGDTVEQDARPHSERARVLLHAEEIVQASACDATVIRYGGLVGGDRHPGRFLAGRTGVPGGDAPVNLIHQEDAVGIAVAVIEKNARNDVFNAVTNEHPSRAEFYKAAAADLGVTPPTFDPSADRPNKTVINTHARRQLGYTFKFPDPRTFHYASESA